MKRAVMYGSGNIGRGFIGQLFSLSGYETQFVDINMTMIDRLNADYSYPLYITKNGKYEKTLVEHVSGVDGRNPDLVAQAIAQADIMATAVGVNVLKHIAKPLAQGIGLRYRNGARPLDIIICENKISADVYLRELIEPFLSAKELKYLHHSIGFVEASIGRMVPAVPAELSKENPLAVCVEEFCQLPVDKDAFRGDIPDIVNLQPFSPFGFFIERKLFMHNMSHAVTAYLGALKGDSYLWESALRPEIKLVSYLALMESAQALSEKHHVPMKELIAHANDLLYRFENRLLGDTIARVGKDTQRKLSVNDRLCGAFLLCRQQGIRPGAIALGIAAGMHFNGKDDPSSEELASYAQQQGVAAALNRYSGITNPQDVALITKLYVMLAQNTMQEVVTYMEQYKRE